MSTHSVRPAVDVAPHAPARPGLALALALISIPGVTIAWDYRRCRGLRRHGNRNRRDRPRPPGARPP